MVKAICSSNACHQMKNRSIFHLIRLAALGTFSSRRRLAPAADLCMLRRAMSASPLRRNGEESSDFARFPLTRELSSVSETEEEKKFPQHQNGNLISLAICLLALITSFDYGHLIRHATSKIFHLRKQPPVAYATGGCSVSITVCRR